MFDFGGMSPNHAIYIPMVALLGLVIGYIAGSKSVRAEYERKRKRMKE
jgi:hypothetical protein